MAEAKYQLDLGKRLTDQKVLSVEENKNRGFAAQKAEAQLAQARAQLKSIETNLDRLTVRALESIVDGNGRVSEAHGYTQLKIDNLHQLKAVDGLLTGLHEPQASHLDLLSAFLPPEQIRAAYEEAIARKYLWHEFGDLNLIL